MKITLKTLVTFFCVSVHGFISAQESRMLSGRVIDQKSARPLSNASVTLKSRTISTVANTEGEFGFYIPGLYANDTLRISVMGYEFYTIPLREVNFSKTLVVRLNPSALTLQEVTVSATLSAEDILSAAIDRIPVNYFSKPFVQNTFYREVQQADGRYVLLIEAALDIYNDGYHKRGREQVKVLQLRKSEGYQHATHSFWDTHNVLLSALGLNTVTYITRKSLKEYTLQREPNTSLNGQPVYILTASMLKESWPVKFYIQCDNFAFVRIEETFDVSTDEVKSWKQANTDTINVFPQKRKVIMEYKPFPEKYSLSMLSHSIRMIYKGAYTNKELLDFTIQQDLLVNNIEFNDVKKSKKEELLRFNVNLDQQPFKYDPDFWKNYNIIKETPLQGQIRKDLEAETPLEHQFENQQIVKPSKHKS
jgi:hypothetical protein